MLRRLTGRWYITAVISIILLYVRGRPAKLDIFHLVCVLVFGGEVICYTVYTSVEGLQFFMLSTSFLSLFSSWLVVWCDGFFQVDGRPPAALRWLRDGLPRVSEAKQRPCHWRCARVSRTVGKRGQTKGANEPPLFASVASRFGCCLKLHVTARVRHYYCILCCFFPYFIFVFVLVCVCFVTLYCRCGSDVAQEYAASLFMYAARINFSCIMCIIAASSTAHL